MKISKILSVMICALTVSTSLYALNSNDSHCDSHCDRHCKPHDVEAPESCLKIVRGTIQLDSLCLQPNGNLCDAFITSTASIVRGKKFSISPEAASPNFVIRFPDITISYLPPPTFPTLLFTRIYEFAVRVNFDCEYDRPPTILAQVESDTTLFQGTAYVSNFDINVLNVTTTGFTLHAFVYINAFVASTQTPPYISPDAVTLMNNIGNGSTRFNFEAIGPR